MPSMEPRMRPRPKGPQFPAEDLHAMLLAFGDPSTRRGGGPLPSTIATLDSIVTDFVISTCHEAAAHATTAGRAKVKQDDFQWALRRDARKLGRVQELLELDRELKMKRRMVEIDEGEVLRGQARADGAAAAAAGPGPGPGRGKRRKRADDGSEKSAADAKPAARKPRADAERVRLSIEGGAPPQLADPPHPPPELDGEADMPDVPEPDLDELFRE